MRRSSFWMVLSVVLFVVVSADAQQQAGSIRGVVYDDDFDAPLPRATVTIVETGESVTTTDEGNYVFPEVPPGRYTVVFSKQGYARQVRGDVIVTAGQLTDVDSRLSGDFTEMEEFVVQELRIGGGTEAGLLQLRLEAPSLIDSISADLMSRAGASDAASALNLVSGATVEDGKFAVVRGLPDRYVNSQLNGVRLPTADADKRAVELDQFPAAVIESIRVTKTFTPDQQGDASGGAVNVVLKGIPDEFIFQVKGQLSFNTQSYKRNDFLSYDGGGVSTWGKDDGSRDIPLDSMFGGAAGVSTTDSRTDFKWSVAGGGKHEFDDGLTIGGFASLFYERDSSFYDNGIDDSLWVTDPGMPMTPQTIQATDGDFKTQLFDVTQGTQTVQWGTLATFGLETDDHAINATYLYTRTAEDMATLAEDTRGKEFFFPGYDPSNPTGPGNSPDDRFAAPYIRTETLEYAERTTSALIFSGRHKLPVEGFGFDDFMIFEKPEFDWTLSHSSAGLWEPDKRQFGSLWLAESFSPGAPPFLPPEILPAVHLPFKPAANFLLGNFQRTWQEITEKSDQYSLNLKLPFVQWSGDEGYLKFGLFKDETKRRFDQNTFSNFNDNSAQLQADFSQFWSELFPDETHPVSDGPPFVDVDYRGRQEINARYVMADLPITTGLNVIGGVRSERTSLSIQNIPEEDAKWFPPGVLAPVDLNPGDADVAFQRDDLLPSLAVVLTPVDNVTVRASYSETVARQTFKELTPIQQQEFLGGDVFIGNPGLQMSSLRNYDFRLDLTPFEGGLISISRFRKKINDPIEYVQRVVGFTFTTPVNYPDGEIDGWEFEVRQDMGRLFEPLQGLTLGANATFIDSKVTLPDSEAAIFASPAIMAPITSRDMTNAPEHLYNFYLTYDFEPTGTQIGLFYTVRGDTLIAGAGQSGGNFVPSVYEREYGNLNLTVTQRIGEHLKLQFQAKNLTNPKFETVYRSAFIGDDVLKTSSSKGIDYSVSLSAEFRF